MGLSYKGKCILPAGLCLMDRWFRFKRKRVYRLAG